MLNLFPQAWRTDVRGGITGGLLAAIVTLPLSVTAILAGCVIIALPMFGDYYTPDLLSGSPHTSLIGNQIDLYIRGGQQVPVGAALVVCLIALVGYFAADVKPRPNGGSWYGYALGTIGALLIVWLSLLGVRKRATSRGHWSLKAWTSAHVYLGLALIMIATLPRSVASAKLSCSHAFTAALRATY